MIERHRQDRALVVRRGGFSSANARRGTAGLALVAGAALLCMGGCGPNFANYITEERSGNLQFQFINNTSARAAFSFGTYDKLDRDPPGTVQIQQLRVEAHTSSAPATVLCRREASVGTADFVQRVIVTNADAVVGFDADAFDDVIHFSTSPPDSDTAALPTAGTALGVEKRLGVDFTCGDRLIFTLQEDPDAPGGFRVDFSVIPDLEDDSQ
ncbi:MAG: hypothetical protein JNG88_06420 [Phycisphaerales bacterium]|nr:hypothetical protein [Phycisphaerales bacterium]